ncbi:unnamed protein product [Spirodela intermedia]|uniref:Uncharacterized protein n=2 Tax=Spirodela intermedia TaxID=51605 RepID=A0A7I8K9W7_SPIIN|nr:unnamed protein product [Spirodela intermedia]CAA6658345.1 unnamed protein product [Spirodela intermedia]CAA7394567.1 unnamed protein product [Spirodela intermedia]
MMYTMIYTRLDILSHAINIVIHFMVNLSKAHWHYIDIKYHFIYNIIFSGEINVQKISTEDNSADMLIKLLPILKFQHCLNLIRIYNT